MGFEEILFRAKQGEKVAIEYIIEMYQPLLAKNALINGVFDEELYQELMLETIKCIFNYKILE